MKKKIIMIAAAILLLGGIAVGLYVKQIVWPRPMTIGEGAVKISCIGDSITYGRGVQDSRETESYPAILSNLLGSAYSVTNYGLSGRTLQNTGEFYYFDDKVGKLAWRTRADILLFMLGTNDSKAVNWDEKRFREAYGSTIEHFQQMGCFQKIYIMIPPRIYVEVPGEMGCNNDNLVQGVIPVIREMAEAYDVELIDLYALTDGHSDWFPDSIHPNAEGNQVIAEEIAGRIELDMAD